MRDFFSGVLFVFTGSIFLISSKEYNVGTISTIGPGFFPSTVSTILIILGLIICIKGLYGIFK